MAAKKAPTIKVRLSLGAETRAFKLSSVGNPMLRRTVASPPNSRWVNIYDDGTDLIKASNGAHLTVGGQWANASDAALKANFADVDARTVLRNLAEMPIRTWNYKAEDERTRHIGPTAQDFAAAFGCGGDDKSIGTIDADGVALAAIKGLYEIVREQSEKIGQLESELESLRAARGVDTH